MNLKFQKLGWYLMSNVVKIYNDLSDVGNHENHIKKIGIFTKKCGKREKLLKCFYG